MNELFLVAIALLCSRIQGNDRAPALVYGLVLHMIYFTVLMVDNTAMAFILAGISDLLVIVLLVCLSGCMRSRLVYFLIPLSVVSMVLHFYGWSIVMGEADSQFHYSLVVAYMFVIMALFAFSAGGYGNISWDNRLLDRNNSRSPRVGVVPK